MSITANSDWSIRVQFSQVPGFEDQCFATATKGPVTKRLPLPGNPAVYPVRLVTRWKKGRRAADMAIDAMVAKYEAGIP